MPNHVTTVLVIDSPNAEEIIKSMQTDNSDFDFNVIVPMPECLKGFEPHLGILSHAKNALGLSVHGNDMIGGLERDNRIRDCFQEIDEKDIPDVIRAMQNYQECGYMYWYDWKSEEWGTKWGAYDISIDGNTVTFDTAWSHPYKMMLALSVACPEAELYCKYADEDVGSNCGEIHYKAGEIIHESIAPRYGDMNEDEKAFWVDFALDTKGYDKEAYHADAEEY